MGKFSKKSQNWARDQIIIFPHCTVDRVTVLCLVIYWLNEAVSLLRLGSVHLTDSLLVVEKKSQSVLSFLIFARCSIWLHSLSKEESHALLEWLHYFKTSHSSSTLTGKCSLTSYAEGRRINETVCNADNPKDTEDTEWRWESALAAIQDLTSCLGSSGDIIPVP